MQKIKNISVGIFLCEDLKQNCNSLKNTFLKYFDNYIFFGKSEDLELPCYTHEKVEGDDYNSATSKHFLCLKKQFEIHNNCDWFYIGGMDIFLHPENVQQLLNHFDPNCDFYIGGHCDSRKINGEPIWFGSGGPGIFLSRRLLERMYPRLEQYIDLWKDVWPNGEHCLYAGCDVATAYFLKKELNVDITKCSGFYHFNYPEYINANKNLYPEGYHLHFELVSHPIAFHNLKPSELIVDLYERAVRGDVPFNNCNKLQEL